MNIQFAHKMIDDFLTKSRTQILNISFLNFIKKLQFWKSRSREVYGICRSHRRK